MDTNTSFPLSECVPAAIRAFNDAEMHLIKNDLSERCICARFAMYLSKVIENTPFSDYYVDGVLLDNLEKFP